MPTTTIVSNQDIDFYFTAVNSAFRAALRGHNRALYNRIAYVPPVGVIQESRVNILLPSGDTMNGTKVKFPISLAVSRPRVWPYGTPRPVEPFASIDVEATLDRYCVPSKKEYYDVFTNDKFGIIKAQLPDMLDRATRLWDFVLAEELAQNGIWDPDGVRFFTPQATPHWANPLKPNVNPYFNDTSIATVDYPNLLGALGLLESLPGPDGYALDTGEGVEILAVAPDTMLQAQLLQVFQGAITAANFGANAAAGFSNPLMGRATVVLFKDLATTQARPVWNGNEQDRRKVFYLFAVPPGEGRPVAVIPQRQPTAYYTGLNGSDHLRAREGAIEYGWDAFGKAKLIVPARAVRVFVNPV